jgi:hypothetical protein
MTRSKGIGRGGARPGAGPKKGPLPTQKAVARFRTWFREFTRAVPGAELGQLHVELAALAEARGFRPPPPL